MVDLSQPVVDFNGVRVTADDAKRLLFDHLYYGVAYVREAVDGVCARIPPNEMLDIQRLVEHNELPPNPPRLWRVL